tara:strand:- start:26 stop:169 length:144 start_codon:yes stop_codon:yes gene_type:complete
MQELINKINEITDSELIKGLARRCKTEKQLIILLRNIMALRALRNRK